MFGSSMLSEPIVFTAAAVSNNVRIKIPKTSDLAYYDLPAMVDEASGTIVVYGDFLYITDA